MIHASEDLWIASRVVILYFYSLSRLSPMMTTSWLYFAQCCLSGMKKWTKTSSQASFLIFRTILKNEEWTTKKFLTFLASIYAVNVSKFQNYLTFGIIVKVFQKSVWLQVLWTNFDDLAGDVDQLTWAVLRWKTKVDSYELQKAVSRIPMNFLNFSQGLSYKMSGIYLLNNLLLKF